MSWLRIASRIAIAGWVVTWGGIALRGADERVPLAHQQAPRPESAAPMFAHSDDCQACHNNLTSPAGEDVSIGVAWRGSIMANAARDPYFHASLRRELIDHPSAASEIEDECARCHLPMAQRVAEASGARGEVFRWLPGAARDLRLGPDRPRSGWHQLHGLPSDQQRRPWKRLELQRQIHHDAAARRWRPRGDWTARARGRSEARDALGHRIRANAGAAHPRV